MKLKGIILMLFLFVMIAISIFFSSSPFAIVQNYVCQNVTIQNQSVNVCGNELRSDELQPVINLLQNIPISNSTTEVNTLSIIQNGSTCYYTNEVKCLGQTITNGDLSGTQYIIKQDYGSKQALCSVPQKITFYYTDCTINKGNVCIAKRCVKYKYQVYFYQLMERLGFKG